MPNITPSSSCCWCALIRIARGCGSCDKISRCLSNDFRASCSARSSSSSDEWSIVLRTEVGAWSSSSLSEEYIVVSGIFTAVLHAGISVLLKMSQRHAAMLGRSRRCHSLEGSALLKQLGQAQQHISNLEEYIRERERTYQSAITQLKAGERRDSQGVRNQRLRRVGRSHDIFQMRGGVSIDQEQEDRGDHTQ